MPVLSWLYEAIFRRSAPAPLRTRTIPQLAWKAIRKWLSARVAPYSITNTMRIWLYRRTGFTIGKHVFIGMHCYLDDSHPHRLVIEDDVYVSYRVTFALHGPKIDKAGCTLRKGCYVGANATILGGVEIGEYATVGACALVTRDVPPFTTVAGIPAKVLKTDTVPWGTDKPILEAQLAAKANAESHEETPPAAAD